jgi:hypothetical protein
MVFRRKEQVFGPFSGYYPKWIDGIAEIDRTFGINTYESEISALANSIHQLFVYIVYL